MDPVTLGLISMGVGGAIKVGANLFSDSGADAMREQAKLKLSALEENMRRTEGQQTQLLSSTKARMAGTGFDASSPSFTNYITTMADEFTKQNEFTLKNGLAAVDLMQQSADKLASPLKPLLGAGVDAASTVASMAKLWG